MPDYNEYKVANPIDKLDLAKALFAPPYTCESVYVPYTDYQQPVSVQFFPEEFRWDFENNEMVVSGYIEVKRGGMMFTKRAVLRQDLVGNAIIRIAKVANAKNVNFA